MKLSALSSPLLAMFIASRLASFQSQPPAHSQQPPQPQQADDVPAIDGGAGPCSVEWTVTDADAKPVYAATVKVHIVYGFAGTRKLDLEAGTNAQGKVLFKGLPAKVRNPPLEFQASKDQLTGVAAYNPAAECQGKHSIRVGKAVSN